MCLIEEPCYHVHCHHHHHSEACCDTHQEEHHEEKKHECNYCICEVLRETGKGVKIKVVTDSGDMIEGKFLGFQGKGCCVQIEVKEMLSPYQPCELIFIDCHKIESIAYLD